MSNRGTLMGRGMIMLLVMVTGGRRAGGTALATEAPISEPAAPAPRRPPLPGQLSTRFGIDPANPEASVPDNQERNRNPLEFGYFLQDLLEQAEQARKTGDRYAVVQYYRAVAKAVPESAKGWSKLCEAYEATHDSDRALRACRYAMERPAVELQDYLRFVRLSVGRESAPSDAERAELMAILKHLDAQPGMELAANHARCELGVKLKDAGMLDACTSALARLAPDDPKTVVFQWSRAVLRGDGAAAHRLVERARVVGVMRESIERMAALTSPAEATLSRKLALLAAGALFAAIALGRLFYMTRRRRALAHRTAT